MPTVASKPRAKQQRLTTKVGFEALLLKVQRALRGASDVDAASALIAVLVHYLQHLSDDELSVARRALTQLQQVADRQPLILRAPH